MSDMATVGEYGDYRQYYTDATFWGKLKKYAKAAGRVVVTKVLTLYYCLEDKDTPAWAKTVIVGALGYFIFPVDLIPDFVPVTGYMDDWGVITAAMAVVAAHIKPEHVERAEEKAARWFGPA